MRIWTGMRQICLKVKQVAEFGTRRSCCCCCCSSSSNKSCCCCIFYFQVSVLLLLLRPIANVAQTTFYEKIHFFLKCLGRDAGSNDDKQALWFKPTSPTPPNPPPPTPSGKSNVQRINTLPPRLGRTSFSQRKRKFLVRVFVCVCVA